MPWDIVRLPCGSMSQHRTRWPSSANATARLRVVVVLATPPFWLANAITLHVDVTGTPIGRRDAYAPVFAAGSTIPPPSPGVSVMKVADYVGQIDRAPQRGEAAAALGRAAASTP